VIDLRDTETEAEFRAGLRSWLASNMPTESMPTRLEERHAFLVTWHRRLYKAGYVGLSWPVEYGGRGFGPLEEAIFSQELAAAGAPPGPMLGYIGRPLLLHGTEEQRSRYLPAMLRSDELWCQGFSEPNAGSDLASLQTKAVDAGDHYLITGQKVWTSYGQFARYCLLLARTGGEGPKQAGITAFVVDLSSPGITIRPIVQMTGDEEFCEVFYDEVRVPKDNIVGSVGQGWEIALMTVAFERGPVDIGYQAKFEVYLEQLADQLRSTGRDDDANRRKLAAAAVSVEVLRLRCLQSLTRRAAGLPPGPDTSVDKLLMAGSEQQLLTTAIDLFGDREFAGQERPWFDAYLYSRAASVYGGTAQIQKNILANRVLKLPVAGR
jgi:alkylation response protein AidB-like acyl-CoA dehydrogenase